MESQINDSNWASRERLRRIEVLLWWRGWIGRRDLIATFGTSVAQASNDLMRYDSLNPGAMIYHTRRKRYESAPEMQCVLHNPDFDEAIPLLFGADRPAILHAWGPGAGGSADPTTRVASVRLPTRAPAPAIARRVVVALLNQKMLRCRYHSLASGSDAWREICPTAFGWDGRRWHTRAFCLKNNDWRDFVLGRIQQTDWPTEDVPTLPPDTAWDTHTTLRLRINPQLSENQREAIRADYHLDGDTLDLRVREAMRPYLLAELFLDDQLRPLPRHFVVDET